MTGHNVDAATVRHRADQDRGLAIERITFEAVEMSVVLNATPVSPSLHRVREGVAKIFRCRKPAVWRERQSTPDHGPH